ncbi:hypothetical protein [Methylotuvimicrobium sp.]|uniref:hypothetical protein n=1 Tax=Methylotuvimicrobium sp. TaxID=2822413 RepID=UPI003D64EE4B
MGKARRNKHLKRQQAASAEQNDDVKISEALIKISEPFHYENLDLAGYRNLTMMAMAAWNIANQPEEKRDEQILGFIKVLPEEQVAMQMFTTLIKRKLELYPNDNRIVKDFKLTEATTEWRLSVTSFIPGISR